MVAENPRRSRMQQSASIVSHFAELADPRQSQNREHKFIDIIVIAICAAICGADDWVAVEQFGEAKKEWFGSVLGQRPTA
jgi:hypothetical protein